MKVYLSGQIVKGQWKMSKEWRQRVADISTDYGFQVLNPLEAQESHHSGYRELIYARNMKLLKEADLVIVRWLPKENSVGTVAEICKAKELNIPVVILTYTPADAAELDEDPYLMHLHAMQSVLHFSDDNLRDVFEWFQTTNSTYSVSPYGSGWKPSFIA